MNLSQPSREEELPEPWYWTDLNLNGQAPAKHITNDKVC